MRYVLTEEGKKYLESGMPELNLIRRLEPGNMALKDAQSMENFSIALQWAKKNGWVEIKNGIIILKEKPGSYDVESALEEFSAGREIGSKMISILLQRSLIEEIKEDAYKRAEKYKGKEVSSLNEDIIKTGVWKEVKFRGYNVSTSGKKIYPGKLHHYGAFLNYVKIKLVSLGFEEMTGPIVETEFWNMDALYMPQYHSARDIHDAYFLKEPRYAKSLDKKLLEAVKNSHEKGVVGSRGWEYQYDIKRAHRLVLRTHDTSISPRTLASSSLKIPGKYFQIAKCFRYDIVDATHLPDFYQMGGFVIDRSLNFRHLIGLLKLFAKEFANTEKTRIMPSYFPFTEPSVQLMAKHPDFGWLELAGAGIFREEMTRPLGVRHPVIAWGAGLDRLFMLSTGITDIRDLFSTDIRYLRSAKVTY
ncbi:MAG: phenylalanine--tRNA ligase subunit alpha [Candidatus Aenigmarchaeota archaeon]|nr:phenylalanine--tRNA ligase subunit alpha [Candidatus Aenigmarchaeota archaeon]MDI6722147.1 phenylalanine--tRNA ligase subunit alpha [Candidatus Aenigmarchaeota archaeon]